VTTGRTAGPDAVLADTLAELANLSLNLDPASRARLAALEGRRIQLNASFPEPLGPREFTLLIQGGRLRLFTHAQDAPNVIVRGAPADLVSAIFAGSDQARLTIDGDATVLHEFSAALRDFRPDLGGPLSQMLGADAARAALGTAELAFAGLRSLLEGAGNTVRDGATRTFVDRAQAERLLDDVDELRLRIDRLGARVAAAEQRKATP
jgi:ubiquinone biosynthesis accessory factor UbiJ